jgi:hypothetical protein
LKNRLNIWLRIIVKHICISKHDFKEQKLKQTKKEVGKYTLFLWNYETVDPNWQITADAKYILWYERWTSESRKFEKSRKIERDAYINIS